MNMPVAMKWETARREVMKMKKYSDEIAKADYKEEITHKDRVKGDEVEEQLF